MYSRGNLFWDHGVEGIGWLLGGAASQEFQPGAGRRLVNRAQLGPWAQLYITAEGTYSLLVGAA